MIRQLKKEDENMVSFERKNVEEVVALFSSFQNAHVAVQQDFEDILQAVPKVISDWNLQDMSKTVSLQEVKDVVFSFGAYKAPRFDGFLPIFFQLY